MKSFLENAELERHLMMGNEFWDRFVNEESPEITDSMLEEDVYYRIERLDKDDVFIVTIETESKKLKIVYVIKITRKENGLRIEDYEDDMEGGEWFDYPLEDDLYKVYRVI